MPVGGSGDASEPGWTHGGSICRDAMPRPFPAQSLQCATSSMSNSEVGAAHR